MSQILPEVELENWKAPFFTVWVGQAFSLFGSTLVDFALVWHLTKTTGSATVLALSTLVVLLPRIVFGPFIGALVDRWNRRLVMILADSFVAIAIVALAGIFWIDRVAVWHIYLIMFIRALVEGFHFPAMQASTSLMVPKEHLSRIAGLNQALNGAMNIIAPPVGALLMTLIPIYAILSIDVVTALVAVTTLFFIPIPQPVKSEAQQAAGPTQVLDDVKEGLRYVRAWPGLIGVMVLGMVTNIAFNPVSALFPLLVTKHFGGGAIQLAWMEAGAGIGIVVGGLLLSAWGGFKRRMITCLTGFFGIGAGILIMGLAPANYYWLALAGIFILGTTLPWVDGSIIAIIQEKVAPEMQGRVMTLLVSAAKAMTPLSLLVTGPIADAWGVRFWYLFGGIFCLITAVVSFLVPLIRNMEDTQAPELANLGRATAPTL